MEQTALPMFEGAQPRLTELQLSGGSKRRTRPYRMHERITLVVEVEVTGISHIETKGGMARRHMVSIADVYELGADRAPSLIEELSEQYDEMFGGMARLPFEPDPQVGEQRTVDGVLCEWQVIDDDAGDGERFEWVPVPPDPPAAADGTIVPAAELRAMGVSDLVDWIGDSVDRARFADELEGERDKRRAGVDNVVHALLDAAADADEVTGDGTGEALPELVDDGLPAEPEFDIDVDDDSH